MESQRDLEHSLQGIKLQEDQIKAENKHWKVCEMLRKQVKPELRQKNSIVKRTDISNRKKNHGGRKQMAQERILMQSKVYKERSSMLEQVRESDYSWKRIAGKWSDKI